MLPYLSVAPSCSFSIYFSLLHKHRRTHSLSISLHDAQTAKHMSLACTDTCALHGSTYSTRLRIHVLANEWRTHTIVYAAHASLSLHGSFVPTLDILLSLSHRHTHRQSPSISLHEAQTVKHKALARTDTCALHVPAHPRTGQPMAHMHDCLCCSCCLISLPASFLLFLDLLLTLTQTQTRTLPLYQFA